MYEVVVRWNRCGWTLDRQHRLCGSRAEARLHLDELRRYQGRHGRLPQPLQHSSVQREEPHGVVLDGFSVVSSREPDVDVDVYIRGRAPAAAADPAVGRERRLPIGRLSV